MTMVRNVSEIFETIVESFKCDCHSDYNLIQVRLT